MPLTADEERRFLGQLDAVADAETWRTLVRWMAPQMCREGPDGRKLLAEAVIRRGLAEHARRSKAVPELDRAEVIAQTFESVGVELATED